MLNHALILVAEDEPFIALDVAMAIEDAVVLTEEIKQQAELETVLANYNRRRIERVSAIVGMSRQICAWEREHTQDADVMGVTIKSMQVAAQPI